jgi:hypothetical protein
MAVPMNPHLGLKIRWPDFTVDPVDESMATALLARGLPPEALREDRTLDLDVLTRHGWWVSGSWICGPPA